MPFPGNRIFPEKIQEIPGPEHSGTSFSQSRLSTGIRDWLFPGLVKGREVYFPDFSRIFSSDKTRKYQSRPGTANSGNELQSHLVSFKTSSGTQTSTTLRTSCPFLNQLLFYENKNVVQKSKKIFWCGVKTKTCSIAHNHMKRGIV